jgi:hypothetical protein
MTNHSSVAKRIASLKAGIETYTGKTVTDIKVVEDPKVSYTFAIRANLEGRDYPIDFLIVGQNMEKSISNTSPDDIAENLEECDFKEWPPKSGALKFL